MVAYFSRRLLAQYLESCSHALKVKKKKKKQANTETKLMAKTDFSYDLRCTFVFYFTKY